MAVSKRACIVLAVAVLVTGCFGYNKSAKRWAYVGDTILMLGGGGAIAGDVVSKPEPCMDTATMKCGYTPPFSGALLAGAVLVAAGVFGIVFNATRTNVKTSR